MELRPTSRVPQNGLVFLANRVYIWLREDVGISPDKTDLAPVALLTSCKIAMALFHGDQ
jgi:hypothetical protein